MVRGNTYRSCGHAVTSQGVCVSPVIPWTFWAFPLLKGWDENELQQEVIAVSSLLSFSLHKWDHRNLLTEIPRKQHRCLLVVVEKFISKLDVKPLVHLVYFNIKDRHVVNVLDPYLPYFSTLFYCILSPSSFNPTLFDPPASWERCPLITKIPQQMAGWTRCPPLIFSDTFMQPNI